MRRRNSCRWLWLETHTDSSASLQTHTTVGRPARFVRPSCFSCATETSSRSLQIQLAQMRRHKDQHPMVLGLAPWSPCFSKLGLKMQVSHGASLLTGLRLPLVPKPRQHTASPIEANGVSLKSTECVPSTSTYRSRTLTSLHNLATCLGAINPTLLHSQVN